MRNQHIWQNAQSEELACWEGIKVELQSEAYWKNKLELWRKISRKIGVIELLNSISGPDDRIFNMLDIGCGPSGILCYLSKNNINKVHKKINYYGVDPLISHYLTIVPQLQNYPINWVNSLGEEISQFKSIPDSIDMIFCLNAIDHCKDIDSLLDSIGKYLRIGGIAIISLNCHSSAITAYFWKKYGIEKLHPYQMTKEMFIAQIKHKLLKFKFKNVISLDKEYFWLKQQNPQTFHLNQNTSIRSLMKNFMSKIGCNYIATDVDDLAIFHHYAFIFEATG